MRSPSDSIVADRAADQNEQREGEAPAEPLLREGEAPTEPLLPDSVLLCSRPRSRFARQVPSYKNPGTL